MKKLFSIFRIDAFEEFMFDYLNGDPRREAFELELLDPEKIEVLSHFGLQIMFAGILLKVLVIIQG